MKQAFVYAAVALIAAATMVLELLQTKVLSVLFYNHVVYLTVTIALLGFGISGALVSIASRRLDSEAKLRRAVLFALSGFALSSLLCLRAASYTPLWFDGQGTELKLLFCYGTLVVPFLFSGAALGLIFFSSGRDIHRLYFFDLAATAIGVLIFTFLLRPLGAVHLAWLGTALGALSVVAYALAYGEKVWLALLPAAACVVMALGWGSDLVNLKPERYKWQAQIYRPGFERSRVELQEWTSIAKIDVLFNPDVCLHASGPCPAAAHSRVISQDGDAFTVMYGERWNQELMNEADPSRGIFPQNLVYLLRPQPEASLIIGAGGGPDVVYAKGFGARHITAVEINPATYSLVRGPYLDWAKWPAWPEVNHVLGEGRHFVEGKPNTYDTIIMSGVDTFTALSSGAYVLSENYLYTVEAVESYLAALKPQGAVGIFRWLFPEPRESLRLSNLYLYAADRAGIQKPSQSIMVVGIDLGWDFFWGATLMKKEPFTPEEVNRLLSRIAPFKELFAVYVPDVFEPAEQARIEKQLFETRYARTMKNARQVFRSLIRTRTLEERKRFEAGYVYNIEPVSDDRPFFFEYNRFSELVKTLGWTSFGVRGTAAHFVLYLLFAATSLVSVLAIALPLWMFEREGLRARRLGSLLAFFCCLGIGFMFVELGVVQRLTVFLGHPMHSLSVVIGGLLLLTGLGSLRAGRLGGEEREQESLKKSMLKVVAVVVLWLPVSELLVRFGMTWPLWFRVVLVLASLVPMGLAMGVPFATALRHIERHQPRFIPWAWGINGLTSVMASILAVILAMRLGFSAVILLGAVTYLLGYVCIRAHLRRGF